MEFLKYPETTTSARPGFLISNQHEQLLPRQQVVVSSHTYMPTPITVEKERLELRP